MFTEVISEITEVLNSLRFFQQMGLLKKIAEITNVSIKFMDGGKLVMYRYYAPWPDSTGGLTLTTDALWSR